jgi:hypothetical protein
MKKTFVMTINHNENANSTFEAFEVTDKMIGDAMVKFVKTALKYERVCRPDALVEMIGKGEIPGSVVLAFAQSAINRQLERMLDEKVRNKGGKDGRG